MNAEVIATGSELFSDTLNTNGIYISGKLLSLGINVVRQTVVGDSPKEMESAIKEAFSRSNIIIITGGLGPTFDDITCEIVCKVLGKKLVFSREALSSIAAYFAALNKQMNKINEKQAYIAEGAVPILNSAGTAPGQIIKSDDKLVVLLPGPHRELRIMFEKDVFPFLKKKYERGIVKIKIFHTTGVPESVINEKIKDIVTLEKKLEEGSLKFSILAHVTGVDIKMVVSGTNEMLIDKTLRNIAFEIRGLLKEDIYSEDGKSMEKVICELLVKAHKNLAVAESCTGGLLAHKITNVTGSSAVFLGGMVTYSDFMKKTILGVKEETITNFKAVSGETAGEMAECVRKIMASDFGLSTTGVAGPGKSSDGIPAGTAYIALARDSGTIIKELKFAGSRAEIKAKIVQAALDMLRRELM